jgi:ABC-type glycerol-3-phosphate transport system permease component
MLSVSLSILTPIYFIFITAFKDKEEYVLNKWGLPKYPTLANFQFLFSNERLFRWLENSLILSISSVIVGTIIASFAAYAIARFNFRGKGVIFTLITSLIVIPPVVLLIPLFKMMVRVNLVNNYLSAFIVYVGIMLPFSTYLLTSFFRTIHMDLIDAARMDGCGPIQIFYYIIIPISKPAIITTILVNWLLVWNEMLIALVFLQKDQMRTLMIGLASFKGKYSLDVPLVLTGVLFAIFPTLIIYIFGQRFFIKGLTAGAIRE